MAQTPRRRKGKSPIPRRIKKLPPPVSTAEVIQTRYVALDGPMKALMLGGSYSELLDKVKREAAGKSNRVQSVRLVFRVRYKGSKRSKLVTQKRNIGTKRETWDAYLKDRLAESAKRYIAGFKVRSVNTKLRRDPKTGRFVGKSAMSKRAKPGKNGKKRASK